MGAFADHVGDARGPHRPAARVEARARREGDGGNERRLARRPRPRRDPRRRRARAGCVRGGSDMTGPVGACVPRRDGCGCGPRRCLTPSRSCGWIGPDHRARRRPPGHPQRPADPARRVGRDRGAGHSRPPVARAGAAARAHVGGAARARRARAHGRGRGCRRGRRAPLPPRSSAIPSTLLRFRGYGAGTVDRRRGVAGRRAAAAAAARAPPAGLGAETVRRERDPDRRRRTRRGACSGLPCFRRLSTLRACAGSCCSRSSPRS